MSASPRYWRRVHSGVLDSFADVAAVPGTPTVWAAGYDGTLVRGDDGGERWARSELDADRHLRAVHFTDALCGLAAGWRIVVRTEDGGRSWRRVEVALEVESVRLASPAVAIAVGLRGLIARTRDGGHTWHRVRSPTRAPLRAVWVHDEREALAVGDGGVLVRTADGGATWSLDRPTRCDLCAVYFADRRRGWIAGADGTLLRTEDGGLHWARGANALGTARLTFAALAFIDARTGWALGSGLDHTYTPIVRTEDGGQTWEREFSGVVDPINAAVIAGRHICAVGRFGTVLLRDLDTRAAAEADRGGMAS